MKRLDHALDHMITFLEDESHDHLVKSLKGKITRKRTIIANNHKKAVQLQDKFHVELNNGIYILTSKNDVYIVSFYGKKCSKDSCSLFYKDCENICLDISCSCFENSIHFEMCIHCHVAILYSLCNSSRGSDTILTDH